MHCPTCHHNSCKAVLYKECLRESCLPCQIPWTTAKSAIICTTVLFLGSMEPLEGAYVFASQCVLLTSSAASVPMQTQFTLVIEILMRMGLSYKLDIQETMNPSSLFFQTLFLVKLILRVARKSRFVLPLMTTRTQFKK